MGGSGGGYFRVDPRKVDSELEASERGTEGLEYEAEANRALQELLIDYNNRDNDAISRYLDKIRGVLNEELEGTIDLRFGGSVAKHTYVDGLSDVDSLVLINKSELLGLGPKELISTF